MNLSSTETREVHNCEIDRDEYSLARWMQEEKREQFCSGSRKL